MTRVLLIIRLFETMYRQNLLIYNYTIDVPLSSGGNVAFICLTEWVVVVAVCGVALVDNGGWDAPEIVSNVLTLIKIITTYI